MYHFLREKKYGLEGNAVIWKTQVINQQKPRSCSESLRWTVNYWVSATGSSIQCFFHAHKPNRVKGKAPNSSPKRNYNWYLYGHVKKQMKSNMHWPSSCPPGYVDAETPDLWMQMGQLHVSTINASSLHFFWPISVELHRWSLLQSMTQPLFVMDPNTSTCCSEEYYCKTTSQDFPGEMLLHFFWALKATRSLRSIHVSLS